MAEISLTHEQIRAVDAMAESHKGGLRLTQPPKHKLWNGLDYVEIELIDPEGQVAETEVFTYAGVRPRAEAIPPEWGSSDD